MKQSLSRTIGESEAVMTITTHLWLRLRCVGLLLELHTATMARMMPMKKNDGSG